MLEERSDALLFSGGKPWQNTTRKGRKARRAHVGQVGAIGDVGTCTCSTAKMAMESGKLAELLAEIGYTDQVHQPSTQAP